MADRAFNTLTEPIFKVRFNDGSQAHLTLPEILANLAARDDIADFPGLRPHQAHPWYAFLVQLAAMAVREHGADAPPPDADLWHTRLVDLTNGDDAAWCLVVDDLGLPAFFQSPVPEGHLRSFRNEAETPDSLDVLVTAKNHDVKAVRMTHAQPEHWAYALLTLQTMEGFSGRDNYGIARMNGGFSSRPFVGYAPGLRWGHRFRRDLTVLIETCSMIRDEHGFAGAGGLKLLWLEPWDGTTSFSPTQYDPLFLEICRRVRLVTRSARITAVFTATKMPRTEAKQNSGDLGDPWMPVSRVDAKALTVSKAGFSYRLAQELLFGAEYRGGVAQQLYAGDAEQMLFWGQVMVRGQGKTEGLHERILPLPATVRATLMTQAGRDALASLAKRRIHVVDLVRKKVLHTALCALLQAGADKLDFRDERTARWTTALDRSVDHVFFERLWRDAEQDPVDADRAWAREVLQLAEEQLNDAIQSSPLPAARRYRAVAAATAVFRGAARRHLPDVSSTDVVPSSAAEQGADGHAD